MGRRGPRPTKGEAIARAALALFVEKGVRGATTRAIARRAHTTEGNLYRYYANKQELARHVLTRCLVDFGMHLVQALVGRSDPRQRLRGFVRAYVEYARSHPAEHALIIEAHLRDLGELPADVLRPRHILTDVLKGGIASGDFAACDPRIATPFIAGGLARAVQVLAAPGESADLEKVVDQLADQVERMIGTSRPPRPKGKSPREPKPTERSTN